MSKLIVEGEDLGVVKNVVKAMGNYKVTELIANDDPIVAPTIIDGTCSACPYFTEVIGGRANKINWGTCGKYSNASVNREHVFCKSYEAESEAIRVKEFF